MDHSNAAVNFRRPSYYNHRSPLSQPPHHPRDSQYRPKEPPDDIIPKNRPANFIVELLDERSSNKDEGISIKERELRRSSVISLIKECCCSDFPFDSYFVPKFGVIAGRVFFTQWNSALEAIVRFWRTRIDGIHDFTPNLIPNVVVPSDVVELNCRLTPIFADKIESLVRGEVVKKLEEKIAGLEREIAWISDKLRKNRSIRDFDELTKKRKGVCGERDLILRRIREFKSAMKCIDGHIQDYEQEVYDEIPPFRFKKGVNWARIYALMLRECRRLDDGLPMYDFRQEILKRVSSQQIMVLIGETGSGKSTQVVQFLVDSGLVGDGSIVCTQPRKIAAISLEHRVREESHGCYEDNYVTCIPYYSSTFQFKGDLIYMTDHCLLQHCMNDKNLKGISCILVDEAHERSLNTDLLLAMLKRLLPYRSDLRLIIMSATADAMQLSKYFFGCEMFAVKGRKFPVSVKYVPCFQGVSQSVTTSPDTVAPYVSDTVKMVTEIHEKEQEGTILAFLTSQMEVEWASDRFKTIPGVESLALHGKLSQHDQSLVFKNYPGQRKIIFTTNVAETSLTIPGVRFVVDSGMMKESKFEPGSGMNVLRVCAVSKSSANQREGRAGRTEPGCCYRLYSEDDFRLMPAQQDPEIRRVHLGVAVLKIVASGVKNVRDFDFVDSPSSDSIDMAVRNLVQLGAVTLKNGDLELTDDGRYLVKLGIEPRLGKLILSCFSKRLGKEGVVLAALMANSGSIFCRVGNQSDKLKSDCLKVPFCHSDGDLFTLLAVFKAWESEHPERRNRWCWENSINARAMRRCHDSISELENCLKTELRIVVPSYWSWTPEVNTLQHKNLKKAILASLAENVAMFSGCDKLGYKVALTGQHVQLHPSCSLLMFNHNPNWVVFSEILSASCQYLVCVTAFDGEFFTTLSPPPLFDPYEIEKQKLQLTKLSGMGKTILKKFCGKSSNGLLCLVSKIRRICRDDRVRIEVDIDKNTINILSAPCDVEKVSKLVEGALDNEKRWLSNECMERCLYHGSPGVLPPVALFGAGAEIKYLELDKRCLTVDLFHPNVSGVDDKELVTFIESHASGICSVHKCGSHTLDTEDLEKWGSITFLTPDAAIKASKLNNIDFDGCKLRVNLSRATFGVSRAVTFPVVRAKLFWPRRLSKGMGILKCDPKDVEFVIKDLSDQLIGKRYIRCEAGKKTPDSVVITGIDRLCSETEILHSLRSATSIEIMSFFLVREDAVVNPPCHICEEILFRELSSMVPKGSPQINFCRVRVYPPDPKHIFMRALVTFDGRLHLEAAKALEQIEGTTLPGFQPWQKIECQRLFHTSISCPSSVYDVIKREIELIITGYNRLKGTKCTMNRNTNGSVWVKISATATKTVTELRRPLEELMRGKTITHSSITPDMLQLLYSRDGIALMKSFEREMGVSVLFDRQRLNVRIFGPYEKTLMAENIFIKSLITLHQDRPQEIHLRGNGLPSDLMKQVVSRFGHDLHGLKETVPNAEFALNTRRHVISISGSREAKQKVEEIVNEIAQASGEYLEPNNGEETCPICLCQVEDEYQLESCNHVFCKSCLLEQCESAIRNKDSFPLCCFHEGCKVPILVVDLKSLLSSEKLDELFEASMVAFVSSSCGKYRFCPSPDCPSVYKVAEPDKPVEPFLCGACYAETCTNCHLENHSDLSCEKYKEYKEDPDLSLKEWSKDKVEFVKKCPGCGYTIEKAEGCNHVECKCSLHLCWVCLQHFLSSEACYEHLRAVHQGIS